MSGPSVSEPGAMKFATPAATPAAAPSNSASGPTVAPAAPSVAASEFVASSSEEPPLIKSVKRMLGFGGARRRGRRMTRRSRKASRRSKRKAVASRRRRGSRVRR